MEFSIVYSRTIAVLVFIHFIWNFSCTKFHLPDSQMKHLHLWKLMLRWRFSFLFSEQPVSERGLSLVNAPGITPRLCPGSREISLETPHHRVRVVCMLKYPNNFANFHVKPFQFQSVTWILHGEHRHHEYTRQNSRNWKWGKMETAGGLTRWLSRLS